MCPDCGKKLTFKKALMALGVLSIAFYFGSAKASDSKHSKMKMNKEMTGKMKRKTLSEDARKEVISILEANEELHQSFFKYDGKAVEKAAQTLSASISKVSDKEIKKLLTFSKTKLDQIKASNDREENNQNYHLVSMALIHVVNKYDVGSKYNAYSCPMVKKKWLQNSKKMSKVHNPYATGMPHCGSQDSHH